MASMPPVYIVSATRTPIGAFLGSLSSMRAPELGAAAIKAAVERAKLQPSQIGEVFMGNVLQAGVGQAPARQALIHAGLPNSVPATTINKVCGSGMQAIIMAARAIALGERDLVVAGGMESMSNVPYYMQGARTGMRMGDGKLTDGMIFDGLWDPYNNVHMGNCGDACAKEHGFSREQQDDFAKESFRRALAAQKEGMFDAEISAVAVPQKKGEPLMVKLDEGPSKGDPSKFAALRPAFAKDGTVTAANASSLNDGASALVLASEKAVKEHNLEPLCRIAGWGGGAQEPVKFTTAPVLAMTEAMPNMMPSAVSSERMRCRHRLRSESTSTSSRITSAPPRRAGPARCGRRAATRSGARWRRSAGRG